MNPNNTWRVDSHVYEKRLLLNDPCKSDTRMYELTVWKNKVILNVRYVSF